MADLKADDPTVVQQRVEFVGPQVGKELYENGALALLLVSIGIVAYLALRFEWRFAVSAIIANLHDVVIILGFFAFFQWEFSLPVLAAVLAVLGYSVNESVVIADRIRENFRKMRKATVPEIINSAITSTLSRTIITHGCTLMMVLSILFFGGETLHYFALALAIGICFGIYSSALVMASLVMWAGVSREDLVKPDKKAGAAGAEKISALTRRFRTCSGRRHDHHPALLAVCARPDALSPGCAAFLAPVCRAVHRDFRGDGARDLPAPARRFAALPRRRRGRQQQLQHPSDGADPLRRRRAWRLGQLWRGALRGPDRVPSAAGHLARPLPQAGVHGAHAPLLTRSTEASRSSLAASCRSCAPSRHSSPASGR